MRLIINHPFLLLAAYMVLSNAVGAMPEPDASSGKGYRFFYRFAHSVASNILYAVKAKFPQLVDTGNHADAQSAGK